MINVISTRLVPLLCLMLPSCIRSAQPQARFPAVVVDTVYVSQSDAQRAISTLTQRVDSLRMTNRALQAWRDTMVQNVGKALTGLEELYQSLAGHRLSDATAIANVRIIGAASVDTGAAPMVFVDGKPVIANRLGVSPASYIDLRDVVGVHYWYPAAASVYPGYEQSGGILHFLTRDSTDYREPASRLPSVDEFPPASLEFPVGGIRDVVRSFIESLLREARIRAQPHVDDPLLYIITWFTNDPTPTGSRRFQRTSYRLRLASWPDTPACTRVSLSWLRESRGINESTWRISDDVAAERVPAMVDRISDYLSPLAGPCK